MLPTTPLRSTPARPRFLAGILAVVSLALPGRLKAEERPPSASSVPAKKDKTPPQPSEAAIPEYWAPRKMEMRFGLQFHSNDNHCAQLHATLPFPKDWPEQKVTVIGAELPDNARYQERELSGGVKQLVIEIPALAARQQLDVVVSVEIEKSFINPPADTASLVLPKKTLRDKDLAWYLGDSPLIDTKSRQVRDIVKELKDRKPENAWLFVESIYDWVRDNIQYRNGTLRSTKEALRDKYGDCEEMTGIFIALCRASNIPARCVWIPEHCYPEFYLEDENGFGHWYPCQVAGERQFGRMQDYRPILQKGDRFKIPEENGLQRYVAEFFTCQRRAIGSEPPSVVTIRDLGPLQAEMEEMKARTEPTAAPPTSQE